MSEPDKDGGALRVGVFGAGGRMGRAVCGAVAAAADMELVAAVDPEYAGIDLRQVTGEDGAGLLIASTPEELARAEADVAVDFTVAEAAIRNLKWCATHGVHAVVGTTGLAVNELDEISALFSETPANCLVAANFAIGAVLMARFSELAAPFMEGAEIIELHHDEKVDAPSGTALYTAELISRARGESAFSPDPTRTTNLTGVRGGETPAGVHLHSVRLPGLVAHQEVIFGALGQSLTIRHDAYDRTSFMPGVLLAIRSVSKRDGLTVGLGPLLGF